MSVIIFSNCKVTQNFSVITLFGKTMIKKGEKDVAFFLLATI